MVRDNQDAFTKVMQGLASVFEKELTPAFQALYFDALKEINIEALKYAAREAIRLNRFFPRPVELRELSRGYRAPQIAAPVRPLLPETPPEIARQRLSEIFEVLNGKFGTTLTVEERGDSEASEVKERNGAGLSPMGPAVGLSDMQGAEG